VTRPALVLTAVLSAMPIGAAGLAEEDLMVVKRDVSAQLLDPGSAVFSLINAAEPRPGGITVVCGLVNAKNRFGGYAGDNVFYGQLRKDGDSLTVDVDIMNNKESTVRSIVEICDEDGVSFS